MRQRDAALLAVLGLKACGMWSDVARAECPNEELADQESSAAEFSAAAIDVRLTIEPLHVAVGPPQGWRTDWASSPMWIGSSAPRLCSGDPALPGRAKRRCPLYIGEVDGSDHTIVDVEHQGGVSFLRCHALEQLTHRILWVSKRDRSERRRDFVRGGGSSAFHWDGADGSRCYRPGRLPAVIGDRHDVSTVEPQKRRHIRDGGVAGHGWKGRRHHLPDCQAGDGALDESVLLFPSSRGITERDR